MDAVDAPGVEGAPELSRIRVLVREGLRPVIALARDASRAPLAEPPPSMWLAELVAGIVEADDHGEAGLRVRAAAEVEEEAGFVVSERDIELLGAGMLPSPGCMVEKFYFAAVEVDPAAQQPLAGDGSPMEEGAWTRWMRRVSRARRSCHASACSSARACAR